MRSIALPCNVTSVMGVKYSDNYVQLAKVCGYNGSMPSLWRSGKRRPTKAFVFLMRLAERHGINAILSGELAQLPDNLARDYSQAPKRHGNRRAATK